MGYFEISNIEKTSGDITFKGIPYQDFDRTRYWSLWGIAKMFETARGILLGVTGVVQGLFDTTSGVYLIKQVLILDPDVQRKTSFLSQFSPKFTFKLLRVGTTSISNATELYNKETGRHLGKSFTRSVHVDRKSGKPKPLPSKFKEKFPDFCSDSEIPELEKTRFEPVPDDAFKMSVRVMHSDIDFNNHTNQCVYIRCCLDCATEAALSGYYKHFTSDMCLFSAREVCIQYVGESRQGDTLTVNTWQDQTDQSKIFFIITKQNGRQVIQAFIVFDKTMPDRIPLPKI